MYHYTYGKCSLFFSSTRLDFYRSGTHVISRELKYSHIIRIPISKEVSLRQLFFARPLQKRIPREYFPEHYILNLFKSRSTKLGLIKS